MYILVFLFPTAAHKTQMFSSCWRPCKYHLDCETVKHRKNITDQNSWIITCLSTVPYHWSIPEGKCIDILLGNDVKCNDIPVPLMHSSRQLSMGWLEISHFFGCFHWISHRKWNILMCTVHIILHVLTKSFWICVPTTKKQTTLITKSYTPYVKATKGHIQCLFDMGNSCWLNQKTYELKSHLWNVFHFPYGVCIVHAWSNNKFNIILHISELVTYLIRAPVFEWQPELV